MTKLEQVRAYAAEQPSFTMKFAAWELGINRGTVRTAVQAMLKAGEVREIEAQEGPFGAVYEWVPPVTSLTAHQRRKRRQAA